MRQGRGCKIGSHCDIADDVVLGDNVTIGNNITIYPNVIIEEDCRILDGSVVGRLTYPNTTVVRKAPETYQTLVIGKGTVIGCHCVLYTGITIKPDVLLADGVSIREGCVLEEGAFLARYVTANYGTVIGKRSRVMDQTHITGNATIGEDCSIAMLVSTANDNDVYLRRLGLLDEDREMEGVNMGHYVVVGHGATINPGVLIGDGAIVGSASLVTRDVPPWTIALGQPAKPVREVDAAWKEKIMGLARQRGQELQS